MGRGYRELGTKNTNNSHSPVHIGKKIYWARHDRTNRGNKLRTLLPGRTLPLRTYEDQCTHTLAVITAAIILLIAKHTHALTCTFRIIIMTRIIAPWAT